MAKKELSLEVTDCRVYPLKKTGKGNLRAFASITLNEGFAVSGLRVVEGKKGVFVSMPQREGKDGEWHDVAFPITKEAREHVMEAVLEAYVKTERKGGKTAKGKK